jgi:hypothetical protein
VPQAMLALGKPCAGIPVTCRYLPLRLLPPLAMLHVSLPVCSSRSSLPPPPPFLACSRFCSLVRSCLSSRPSPQIASCNVPAFQPAVLLSISSQSSPHSAVSALFPSHHSLCSKATSDASHTHTCLGLDEAALDLSLRAHLGRFAHLFTQRLTWRSLSPRLMIPLNVDSLCISFFLSLHVNVAIFPARPLIP